MGVPRVFLAKSAQPFEKREVGAKFQFARVRKYLRNKELNLTLRGSGRKNGETVRLRDGGRVDERLT